MTDELTPAQEERMRRLLTDARYDEPMPAAVAARLDKVLVDLGRQPAAPVTSLDAVRRRRRGTVFLVAAAAVTVLGIGAKPLLQNLPITASDSKADSGAQDKSAVVTPEPQRAPAMASDGALLASPPLDKDSFDVQVRELAEISSAARTKSGGNESYGTELDAAGCPRLRAWGRGELYYASYDGQPGALLFRAPVGASQRVDLFLCGERAPERTTFVPVN